MKKEARVRANKIATGNWRQNDRKLAVKKAGSTIYVI